MIKLAGAIIQDPQTGYILLQHRDNNAPTNPNKWGLFGGHMEGDETPEVTARRELREELGIDVHISEVQHVHAYQRDADTYRYLFSVKLPMDSKLVLGEGQGYAWVDPRKVFSYDLTDTARHDLTQFLTK